MYVGFQSCFNLILEKKISGKHVNQKQSKSVLALYIII